MISQKVDLKNSRLFAHIIGWLCFIIYEVTIITIVTGQKFKLADYSISYAINISFFYTNAYLVLPKSGTISSRQLKLLPFRVLLALMAYLVIMLIAIKGLAFYYGGPFEPLKFENLVILRTLWRGIYFLILSTTYWFLLRNLWHSKVIAALEITRLEAQLEKSNLEQSLIRSENAYLRSQINPHLLFNTLNFLYNYVYRRSDKVATAILLLSDIMRYSLSEITEDGKVEIYKEIEHLENFIKLNQIRFKNNLYLNTLIEIDNPNEKIIPLVLLTLVENIFVHGDLSDKVNTANFHIICKDKQLIYTSFNQKKATTALGFGIGIKNITMRLNTYFPDRYSLVFNDNEEFFEVTLKIKL